MALLSGLKNVARKASGRPLPLLLTVSKASQLTPNMIPVTFAGPELSDFPEDRAGGNCKLMLPEPDEERDHFAQRMIKGPTPARRTYTVRHFNKAMQELSIDFVAHGDHGPASRWVLENRTA